MKVNFFKSMATTAILALSTLSALPMSASAVTDPNGDGIINIADSVFIQSYLNGTIGYDFDSLYLLDFNEDCIVNSIDVVGCQRYCTGMDY